MPSSFPGSAMGRKTKFQDRWLVEKDANGDKFSTYIQRVRTDEFSASCKICNNQIKTGNSGLAALLLHATRDSHKAKAADFFGRSTQTRILLRQTSDQVYIFTVLHNFRPLT